MIWEDKTSKEGGVSTETSVNLEKYLRPSTCPSMVVFRCNLSSKVQQEFTGWVITLASCSKQWLSPRTVPYTRRSTILKQSWGRLGLWESQSWCILFQMNLVAPELRERKKKFVTRADKREQKYYCIFYKIKIIYLEETLGLSERSPEVCSIQLIKLEHLLYHFLLS